MERDRDFVYLDAFVWDTAKNEMNIRKHHISFENAVRIFKDPYMCQHYDFKNSTLTEDRWNCTGKDFESGTFKTLTVSMTERGELKRIFSARKATAQEVIDYETNTARL